MSFEQWREQNPEIERAYRLEVDMNCQECCDEFDAVDDCEACDGSGLRDDFEIDNEVRRSLLHEYEQCLSRDYRLAVRMFCEADLVTARGAAQDARVSGGV